MTVCDCFCLLFGHVDPKAHGYFGNGFVKSSGDDCLRLILHAVWSD